MTYALPARMSASPPMASGSSAMRSSLMKRSPAVSVYKPPNSQ